MAHTTMPGLERRLKATLLGEVAFDPFTRGRYATDASHYQVMPIGVVMPRSVKEAEHALAIAREEGVSVLPRGGGTSQSGQTVNASLVIDCSRHLDHVLELDVAGRRCVVEPGIVLDELNRRLKPHGLWFPVDISTASRATIGGMVGNNSCGARSLRYGNTRENVISVDALLADGTAAHFGPVAPDLSDLPEGSPLKPLAFDLLALGTREAGAIKARFPQVQRRVGGYNIDAFLPGRNDVNLAHILVGSEGTLGFSTRIELKLSPLLGRRAVGACHFGSFVQAMDAAQHLVKLGPIAVELVDRTMLGLAREIAMFQPTIDAVVRGDPEAILFVEFAEDDHNENFRRLLRLSEVIGDLGLGWDKPGAKWGGVIEVLDPRLQAAITEMRTAGLNIMMSMKEEGKPVSFVEDCAVPLEHLAEYTSKLTDIFEKHGTRGTWYAHASVGCLHVRPVLNLRLEKDVDAMRAIAEEAFAMVLEYKGSHSGEHGDGIVRSEFHEKMFGPRLVRAFEEVKDRFDPKGLFNPGKIVRAPKFDDRSLFPLRPGLSRRGNPHPSRLVGLSGRRRRFPGRGRDVQQQRRLPRARRRRDVPELSGDARRARRHPRTRQYAAPRHHRAARAGRARLRRDGRDARALRLLQGLPARMPDRRRHGAHEDRGAGGAPRQARPLAARPAGRLSAALRSATRPSGRGSPTCATSSRALARWAEKYAGLSTRRSLPRWRADPFRETARFIGAADAPDAPQVALFADTFNRYFEPENIDGRARGAGGGRVRRSSAERRPAGRSAAGAPSWRSVWSTRRGARPSAASPRSSRSTARGIPVVGLEPSCVLGFRDEIPALLKSAAARRLSQHVLLFEEYIARQAAARVRAAAPADCRSARCCTATATRNPSPPWGRSRRRSSSCRT